MGLSEFNGIVKLCDQVSLFDECWSSQIPVLANDLLPFVEATQNVISSDKRQSCNIESNGSLARSAPIAAFARNKLIVSQLPKFQEVIKLRMNPIMATLANSLNADFSIA
jgi:hypothetical protein